MPGTWHPLSHQPPAPIDTMLLLTDGSLLCHEYESPNWHRLTPDAYSDYSNGTWQPVTPMPANAPSSQNGPTNAPLYYASAVMRNGCVFVAGGEYNVSGGSVDLLAAEIYDPVADSWTNVPTPPGWSNIGDAPTCVLPDGRILMGNINATDTVILDPETKSWTNGGDKNDSSSEETYTLLPDGTILVADVTAHPAAEKYVIANQQWVAAGSIPAGHDLVLNVPGVSIEIGPAILMPDGRTFCIGASGHTALYTPGLDPTGPGSWAAGPDFPKDSHGHLMRAFDAPACLLPNGRVLCVVGQVITSGGDAGWAGEPTSFFEFDGSGLTPIAAPASAATAPTYNCRLLLLPTGQALFSTCTNVLELYSPDGAPLPAWRPEIVEVAHELYHDGVFELRGRQLNGLSQAVCYGDDAQMATNYPLVRLRGAAGVGTFYCRTFAHSTMAVATAYEIVSTHFEVSNSVPIGEYQLSVIANGIPSEPVRVCVARRERHAECESRKQCECDCCKETCHDTRHRCCGKPHAGERLECLAERLGRLELFGTLGSIAQKIERLEDAVERASHVDAGERRARERDDDDHHDHDHDHDLHRPLRPRPPKRRR